MNVNKTAFLSHFHFVMNTLKLSDPGAQGLIITTPMFMVKSRYVARFSLVVARENTAAIVKHVPTDLQCTDLHV